MERPKNITLVNLALAAFTTVGVLIHFVNPFTQIALILTPILLLVIGFYALYEYKKVFTQNIYLLLPAFVFVVALAIEILGHSTGFPFGSYEYSYTLGPNLDGVPLIIGVNWFSLSFGFWLIIRQVEKSLSIFKSLGVVLLVAFSMLYFDFFLEQVAIKFNYWQWENGIIPIANYVSWFVISAFFAVCYEIAVRVFSTESKNIKRTMLPYIMFWLTAFITVVGLIARFKN